MQDEKQIIQNSMESMLYKGVEHVMLINKNGRVESTVSKTKIFLSKERQEVFFMGIRLTQSLLQEFDDEFGSVEHFVIHRGNAKLVSVPFDSYNIILIMNNDTDHGFLVNKIKEIEESCNSNNSKLEPICVEA